LRQSSTLQKTFRAGETIVVSATLGNRDAQVVDVFFGAIPPPELGPVLGCPGRDAAVLLVDGFTRSIVACFATFPQNFEPVERNLPLPSGLPLTEVPKLFSLTRTPEIPAGAYTFFAALTRAGALTDGHLGQDELLAVAVVSVTFDP
jgi:hypothetical protein